MAKHASSTRAFPLAAGMLSVVFATGLLPASTKQNLPGNPRVIEVNGARFHYLDKGTGDPLVLVHGTLQDYTAWLPQLERLDDRYRVITYSRRHDWPNDNGEAPPDFSARYAARDLAALIDGLELGRVHLVGFSYGALTSLIMTLDRPDLVRTLVLAEPPLEPKSLGLTAGPWIENVPRYAALAREGDLRPALELFASDVLGQERMKQLPEEAWDQIMLNTREFRALVNSTQPFPPVTPKELRRIRTPTLVLLGEANIGTGFEESNDALVRWIPGAEAATIPQASHLMWLEQPATTYQAVLGFLDRWNAR